VGDGAKIRESLKKFGPLEERTIGVEFALSHELEALDQIPAELFGVRLSAVVAPGETALLSGLSKSTVDRRVSPPAPGFSMPPRQ